MTLQTQGEAMITSWSFSKLSDFEKCKFYTYLKHVQRVPEPERPLPPGKTEHANDRGSRIHDACEQYVLGNIHELPPEAEKTFGPELDLMRVMHAEGLVSLEGEWGMNRDWEPTDYKTAWLRLKLDAIVFVDPTHAIVVDYKTGRKFGNEIKHAQQLQLYQLVSFLRYPKLEVVTAELWYIDQPPGENITSQTFTRSQGLRFKTGFDRRGDSLTSAVDFPPNPNIHSCKWCQYGPWNGGQCAVGVQNLKPKSSGSRR
jgi:CRISPR/Cas system-associated exonuclease Cas4 (RecB family)